MTARKTDDLYVRYMKAFQDSSEHTGTCPDCQGDRPCAQGDPLHERFTRLQAAYLARQSKQS